MNKYFKIYLIYSLPLILSCTENIEFKQDEIAGVIQNIETSINRSNLADYKLNSSFTTFYYFNSILCKIANEKSSSRFFTIMPIVFDSDDEFIEVKVSLRYKVDLEIKAIDFDIPPKLIHSIISMGLPDEAYFYFVYSEGRYFLTKIEYPLRYKYMELLEDVI